MSGVPAPLSGLRVLLVEDEPLIAVMLKEYVEDMGCRFHQTTPTTEAALEALETIVPDVVILDLTLAGAEPNFEVADELAAREIPFVFCSGHQPDILPERYRSRPFLGKPFSAHEIEKALGLCHLPTSPPASPTSTSGLSRHAKVA
jgi:CheY-like chemotaxis protein